MAKFGTMFGSGKADSMIRLSEETAAKLAQVDKQLARERESDRLKHSQRGLPKKEVKKEPPQDSRLSLEIEEEEAPPTFIEGFPYRARAKDKGDDPNRLKLEDIYLTPEEVQMVEGIVGDYLKAKKLAEPFYLGEQRERLRATRELIAQKIESMNTRDREEYEGQKATANRAEAVICRCLQDNAQEWFGRGSSACEGCGLDDLCNGVDIVVQFPDGQLLGIDLAVVAKREEISGKIGRNLEEPLRRLEDPIYARDVQHGNQLDFVPVVVGLDEVGVEIIAKALATKQRQATVEYSRMQDLERVKHLIIGQIRNQLENQLGRMEVRSDGRIRASYERMLIKIRSLHSRKREASAQEVLKSKIYKWLSGPLKFTSAADALG